VLCLYTDGLVERRHLDVDETLEVLRTAVAARPPESVCVEVMRRLVGVTTPEDDIAVLVVRRAPA
jgi:phosphoserine phosphatase RsbU/P